MSSLKEYRLEQLQKLETLKNLGVSLYPANSFKDQPLKIIRKQFDDFKDQKVWLAGRLLTIREHGKITFLDIADQSGRLQLILKSENLETADYKDGQLAYKDLDLLTRGDFINIYGIVGKSKKEEISLDVLRLRLLTKVLRPLPLKLEDTEIKRRRRYLDLAINNEIRDRYIRRSMFWQHTREFLNNKGFIEINIPVLEHTTGGADANPFKTHMDSLNQDYYLRISHELPLKKLLGGGYEKVYDIGPRFRNEHHSDEHLPEHVAMEFYQAYINYEEGMKLTEELIKYVIFNTFKTLKFNLKNFEINLEKPWQKQDYSKIIHDYYKIDIFNTDIDKVNKILKTHKIEVSKNDNLSSCIDKLFKNIRHEFAGPFWLVNIPTFMSPLAKKHLSDPKISQRFQLILAGSEASNGFSELNDPIDQLERMKHQQNLREAGNKEAQMLDIDFIEMLEYGMPPACGLGYSERLFWLLENIPARDGVVFPHLKNEIDTVTKDLYQDIL